jgi:hypothetical protein
MCRVIRCLAPFPAFAVVVAPARRWIEMISVSSRIMKPDFFRSIVRAKLERLLERWSLNLSGIREPKNIADRANVLE